MDIIDRAAAACSIPATRARQLTDELARLMLEAASEYDTVSIPRFGTFATAKQDERIDIDLASGRRMLMPPVIAMSFSPAGQLRSAVSRSRRARAAGGAATS